MPNEKVERCAWATTDLYRAYHDKEWGNPVHADDKLFEMLILEGMQAGLSWLTILNKREAFREAFDQFDCRKVACYDDAKIEELMQNEKIVRNRLKLKSAVTMPSSSSKYKRNMAALMHLYGPMWMGSPSATISLRKRRFPQGPLSRTESAKI